MIANLDFQVIFDNLPFLATGLGMSFLMTFLVALLSIFLGAVLASLRLLAPRPIGLLVAAYVNLIRSVPLILVIFWFYFLVPLAIGHPVGPFYSALIAFTLFETAYYSEIIRAGIKSVPPGQSMAGQSAGLSTIQVQRHIVLPQAFRKMTPVLVTQGIVLFQDTSLVYVIGLRDFMTSASIVARTEQRLVESYIFTAVVYLVICTIGSYLVQRLQKSTAQ